MSFGAVKTFLSKILICNTKRLKPIHETILIFLFYCVEFYPFYTFKKISYEQNI